MTHISNSPAAVTSGLSDLQNHDGYPAEGCNCWGFCSYIDAHELLLQDKFLGCNCINKHFVETKNTVFRFLKHLLFFLLLFFCLFFFFGFFVVYFFFVCFVLFFVIKATVQEFEQNQCHDIIMLFNK